MASPTPSPLYKATSINSFPSYVSHRVSSKELALKFSTEAAKDVPSASLIVAQIAEQVTAAQGQLTAEQATLSKRQDLDLDAIAQVLADIVQVSFNFCFR